MREGPGVKSRTYMNSISLSLFPSVPIFGPVDGAEPQRQFAAHLSRLASEVRVDQ